MKRKSEHTLPSDVAWEEIAMSLEVYFENLNHLRYSYKVNILGISQWVVQLVLVQLSIGQYAVWSSGIGFSSWQTTTLYLLCYREYTRVNSAPFSFSLMDILLGIFDAKVIIY